MNDENRESGGAATCVPARNLRHLNPDDWAAGAPEFRRVPIVSHPDEDATAQQVVNHLWTREGAEDGRVFVYADSVPGVSTVVVREVMTDLCAVGLVSAVLYDGGFIVHLSEHGHLFAPNMVGESPFHEVENIIDMSSSTLRGGVYVMRAGYGRNAAIKVGISGNIESRFKQAATFSPWGLTLVYRIPGDGKDERALHQLLRPYRLRGEWFMWDAQVKTLLESFIQTRVPQ